MDFMGHLEAQLISVRFNVPVSWSSEEMRKKNEKSNKLCSIHSEKLAKYYIAEPQETKDSLGMNWRLGAPGQQASSGTGDGFSSRGSGHG